MNRSVLTFIALLPWIIAGEPATAGPVTGSATAAIVAEKPLILYAQEIFKNHPKSFDYYDIVTDKINKECYDWAVKTNGMFDEARDREIHRLAGS